MNGDGERDGKHRRMATFAEIEAAVKQLTKQDTKRLEGFANNLYRCYSVRRPTAETTEDFIQEALVRTISGNRKWYPEEKKLLFHLMNTVASLIVDWSESAKNRYEVRRPPMGAAAFFVDEQDCGDWLEDVASSEPSPEAVLMRKEEYDKLMNRLTDVLRPVPHALNVLMCKCSGSTGKETAKILDLTAKEYEALDRRIRRAAEVIQVEFEDAAAGGTVMRNALVERTPTSSTPIEELFTFASQHQPDSSKHARLMKLFSDILAKHKSTD